MKYKTKVSKMIEQYIHQCYDQSFSAHHLYEYIVKQGKTVNLSTIYRNLDQFVDEGKLTKFKAGHNDAFMYRVNQEITHCHEHLHLQCCKCGKIIHVDRDLMKKLVHTLENDYHFYLECDASTISGICKECREK